LTFIWDTLVLLMKTFSSKFAAVALLVSAMSAMAEDPYSQIINDQQSGRYVQALSQIDHLLGSNQNDIRALLLKGNVNKLMGNTTQAVNIFKQLINQYPQMPEAYNNLAVLYADSGQTTLAIETLQQVFSTSNSYATAYKNLRTLYNQMASSAYREALDLEDKSKPKKGQYALLNNTAAKTTAASLVATTPQVSPTSTLAKATSKPVDNTLDSAATITSSKTTKPIDADSQVTAMVGRWAKAWSSRKVARYFSYYHNEFVPPKGMSRKVWENYRGKRLTKPKVIDVQVVGLSIKHGKDNRATALFEQHYRSDRYEDIVVKQLSLKKTKGRWLIIKETTL
jgi:tetratricopeptide (TPR) repeat protein